MLTVSKIIEQKGTAIYSVHPDSTVFEALQVLADKEIGALLVIENDKMVGIFSERDYARKIILKGFASRESLVRNCMTSNVISVSMKDDISECMSLMTKKKIRHLPVMEEGKLIGIITIGDVVNGVINSQRDSIESLEAYITGTKM